MRYVRLVWRFTAGPAAVGMMTACSGAFSADLIDRADSGEIDMDAATYSGRDSGGEPGPVGRDASGPEVGGGQDEAGPLPQPDASIADASVGDAKAHDASTTIDAAPPPPTGVVCGAKSSGLTCYGSETCCATAKNNGYTYACITHGSTCSGLPIECADSADCTNSLACCYDTTSGAAKVACIALSTCKAGQLLCDPDLAAAACPTGFTCQPYGGTVPYYACK